MQRKQRKQKMHGAVHIHGYITKERIVVLVAITIMMAATILASAINVKKYWKNPNEQIKIEQPLAYNRITDDDANISNCEYVKFSAFFTKDIDEDGYAEKYDGTCNQISRKQTLWFDINVTTDGTLTQGKININGQNFDLETKLVKDLFIKKDYIGKNITQIELQDIKHGSQKLFSGFISAKIYDNTNNYSVKTNKIILTGKWVSTDGTITKDIRKEINLKVDWYGKTSTSAYSHISTSHDIETIIGEKDITATFDVGYIETARELLIKKQVTEIEVPKFNNYSPTEVTTTSQNCSKSYNAATRKLTLTREAKLSGGRIIDYVSRDNVYTIKVKYPIEAYRNFENDVMTLNIPTTGYYYGYNNSNIELNYPNPHMSLDKTTWTHTWRKENKNESEEPTLRKESFSATIGRYVYNPDINNNIYIVSKKKPLKIYNNADLDEDNIDNYIVRWDAFTGERIGNQNGIYFEETKTDELLNSSAEYSTNMSKYISTTGLYFLNITQTLGDEGWLKVYDSENNLIETFTRQNWDKYTQKNPYEFRNPVKGIKIQTSKANKNESLSIYQIKEIDDYELTADMPIESFNNQEYIFTYYKAGLFINDENSEKTTEIGTANAYYEAEVSLLEFEATPTRMSNQKTENINFKIKTQSFRYNESKWKDGIFLIELPEEILDVKINSVTSDNSKINITSFETFQDKDKMYIKIYTQNDIEGTYELNIDTEITADPRKASVSKTINLYAVNSKTHNYRITSRAVDNLDVNSDGNTSEYVLHKTEGIQIVAPSSIITSQTLSDYDDENNQVISPQIAIVDKTKNTRDAKINITISNNYDRTVSETTIIGKIPFEGNRYQLNGNQLGSTYSVTMKETGIEVPEKFKSTTTVYYSTNEIVTEDINDKNNNFVTADQVSDWSQIKTFAIDLSKHILNKGDTITFSYGIIIPANINYNNISYSTHAVYFCLNVEDGKLGARVETNRLGIMIAKKYDLNINKYKLRNDRKVKGATYKITDGTNTRTRTTNEYGNIVLEGLYVEKEYTLKEIAISDSYILNDEEIKFTITVDDEGNPQITTTGTLKEPAQVENIEGKLTLNLTLENEAKYDVKITKTGNSGEILNGVKYRVKGGEFGELGRVFTTNEKGQISLINLIPRTTYTAEEVKATGYYLPQKVITFSAERKANGNFEVETDSDEIRNAIINQENVDKDIINVNFVNEKIPTYTLKLVKKNNKDELLANTQFKLTSIDTEEFVYAKTNEQGIANIDGLYLYVEGKYVTGEYILEETLATEGYITDNTKVKFRVEQKEGSMLPSTSIEIDKDTRFLEMQITEGEEIITNQESDKTSVTLEFKNKPVFKLIKKGDNDKILPNAKFTITDLDGNIARDSKGEPIGELQEDGKYTLSTDENGELTANLVEGLYKLVEVEVPEEYELPANEEDRTYYVGIGRSKEEETEFNTKWIKSITGQGHSNIYDAEPTNDGYIVCGSYRGDCDLDQDGTVDLTSAYNEKGLVVKYDQDGNIQWHYEITSKTSNELYSVEKTSTGEYIIVGNEGDTGVIVKLSSSGSEIWKKNISSDKTTQIKNIKILKSTGDIIVVGRFNGTTLNIDTKSLTNQGNYDGFIAKYTLDGNCKNLTGIHGASDINITDVVETSRNNGGYVISVDFLGTIVVNGENVKSKGGQDSILIGFTKDGVYQWRQVIGGTKDESIVKLEVDEKDCIWALGGSSSDLTFGTTVFKTPDRDGLNCLAVNYTSNGTYIQNYYFGGKTERDEKLTCATPTSDGGMLFGGFYSSATMDIEKDGNADITSNEGRFDGILIKLNDLDKIEWTRTIQGDQFDVITSVKELNNKSYMITGIFDSITMSSANKSLNSQGYMDAFMVNLGQVITTPEIQAKQEIIVQNELKRFKITTEIDINSDNERAGGTITGEATADSNIKLAEEVKYEYDGTTPISIIPSPGYSIYSIEIDGEKITNLIPNATGSIEIPIFKKVTEDHHIKVIFEKGISSVTVHHCLKDRDGNYINTVKLADDEYYTGKIGETYTTSPKIDIEGYELEKKENGEYKIPQFASGEYAIEAREITYYYEEKKVSLTVHHYLEGTEQELLEEAEPVIYLYKGEQYTTSSNEELLKTYDLVSNMTRVIQESSQTSGYIQEDTIVTYYYKLKEYQIKTKINEITFKKYDEISNKEEVVTVKGGTITGENEKPYETVIRGEDSQKDIKIKADSGYRIKSIKINGIDIKDTNIGTSTDEQDNSILLDKLTQVTEDQEIVVEFEPIQGTVTVNHFIKGTTKQIALEDGTLVESESKTGYVGNLYATQVKEDRATKYVYDSVDGDVSGRYTEEDKVVTYYYKELIDIDIVKKWNHTDNIYEKPKELIIELYVNGNKDREIVMKNDNNSTIEGELEVWKKTIEGLSKYDDEGNEIVYTIVEKKQ